MNTGGAPSFGFGIDHRVRDAVAGALDSMTLADLVPPRIPEPIQPTPIQGAPTRP